MTTKKLLDSRETIVADLLAGYAAAYPNRVKVKGNLLCRKTPKEHGKVGIVVANGSGHEPAMIDLVGKGLLDVNVCGDIFTAPPPFDILEGIKMADYGAGVLLLVSSHQGDILNARMAAMMAKAEGIRVDVAILYDDISSAPPEAPEERRGTAGLFFCWKTACAAAELGWPLERCTEAALKTRDNLRTLSVAVRSGMHPVTGAAMFELPDDEIEVGMGVHGEAGSGRMKLPSAAELASYMLKRIVSDRPYNPGENVMVLLNSAGATTRMELLIVFKSIAEILQKMRIGIARSWVGSYVTTQEMAGLSISLCAVDDELLALYDYPAESPLYHIPF